MTSHFRPALVIFGALTILCGVLYPLAVSGVASAAFPAEAAGSLVQVDGKTVGSSLIGQSFSSPKYFWGRPSGTGPMSNNGAGSSGTNFGPTNAAQIDAVKGRIDALKALDPSNTQPIPVDLVTASASGLDPEISPAAARQFNTNQVLALIEQHTRPQYLGFFGEPRVNVLALNLALDQTGR